MRRGRVGDEEMKGEEPKGEERRGAEKRGAPTSMIVRKLALGYRALLNKIPMPLGWCLIVFLSFLFAFRPSWASYPAILFFLSAYLLSLQSARMRRFFYGASVFFLFWYLVRTLLSLSWSGSGSGLLETLSNAGSEGEIFYPASFLVYVFLGLHLFFVWTPLDLGRGCKRVLSPILGERRALMISLCLMTLCLAAPIILEDALKIKKTLRRFPHLSLREKLALWGGNLVRMTLDRAGSLGRALSKRQVDLS
jgi:hypothetical protein